VMELVGCHRFGLALATLPLSRAESHLLVGGGDRRSSVKERLSYRGPRDARFIPSPARPATVAEPAGNKLRSL